MDCWPDRCFGFFAASTLEDIHCSSHRSLNKKVELVHGNVSWQVYNDAS